MIGRGLLIAGLWFAVATYEHGLYVWAAYVMAAVYAADSLIRMAAWAGRRFEIRRRAA